MPCGSIPWSEASACAELGAGDGDRDNRGVKGNMDASVEADESSEVGGLEGAELSACDDELAACGVDDEATCAGWS